MSRTVREHIRSNVVGYVALFCFVTMGTAQALPAKNTVDSGDIKKGNVKATDLANNSVSSAKVADGSLLGADVADNTLTGSDINESSLSLGPTTPSGPAGGSLSGDYPNPAIAAGAVSGGAGGQIADDTVTDEDLAGSAQFNGAAAGADLTGTYPSPTIGPNAVGTAEVTSLNSDDIADASLRASDLGAAGVVSLDFASVPAQECLSGNAVLTGAESDDLVIVNPTNTILTDYLSGELQVSGFAQGGAVGVKACNVSIAAINPGAQNFALLAVDIP